MCADGRPFALLLNPPIYDFALYDLFLKPYALLRIGAWLEQAGWAAKLVDGMDYHDEMSDGRLGAPRRRPDGTGKFHRLIVEAPPALRGLRRRYARYGILPASLEARLAAAAADGRPDLILIGSGMTYWYPGVVEASRTCRRMFPGSPQAIGGVYATLLPDHARRVCEADLVVAGPAQAGLPSILEALHLPAPPAGSAPGPTLPSARTWRDAGVLRLNQGCPFKCSYCASALVAGGFAAGDPGAAFEEMARMYRGCGTRNFAFYDDALLVSRERVLLPFLEWAAASFRDASFYVPNAVHTAAIDGRTARLMLAAGFRELRLGYESSSDDFHAAYDGKMRSGDLIEAVRTLLDAGFRRDMLSVYVLAGLPGQPAAQVEESIRAAASAGVRVRLAEYSPVPGTALWKDGAACSRYPIEEEPLFHNNTFFPMEWQGFTRRDLDRLKVLARYLQPARS